MDDLGIADLGCFGNDTIKTPNDGRLAVQGPVKGKGLGCDMMSHRIPVCKPNRAELLTGGYHIRSELAAENNTRMLLYTSASSSISGNETTFAGIASAAGFRTEVSLQCSSFKCWSQVHTYIFIKFVCVSCSVWVCVSVCFVLCGCM